MKYATLQKTVLTDFLSANADSAMSADEIYNAVSADIGKSTVYRLLSELASEGKVNKFAKENGKGVLYQISHGNGCHSHLHMKCLKCDKVYHMDEKNSERILKSIKEDSDFSVSEPNTVLFGICRECGKKQ